MNIVREKAEVFIAWTKRKIFHHFAVAGSEKQKYFREKEIWWAALGKNIGYEMDGKREYFSRPVLIVKKYSVDMCFILPLTTQVKSGFSRYQYKFILNDKINAANLSQGRTISSKRLMQKFGTVDAEVFEDIIQKFVVLLEE